MPLTNRERQALRDMTNQQLDAAEEYFKTGDYKTFMRKMADGKPAASKKQPAAAAGTKRKSQEASLTNIDLDEINIDDMYIDKSCQQVRGMIRKFLESGEMKIGEFCSTIGVSNKSLNDFLRQTGTMKGSGSSTYTNAWTYFKKREIAGLKMPSKKAKPSSSTSSSAAAPTIDISTITLPGEALGNVPVYETCDEIRKKITAHLTKPGITAAQFCRDIAAPGQKIQSKQLTDFRGKKGPRAGNTSCVFYAAYVFFEKLRVAEGKPKSKHRLEMEDAWGAEGGFDLVHGAARGYWCGPNERPREDNLGRVTFR